MAAIAPWFHLRLQSCGPGFEYQAHHLCFFQFVLLKLYRENNENKQKEAGIGPFLKKNINLYQESGCSKVGRSVASDARGPGQDSSRQQFLMLAV